MWVLASDGYLMGGVYMKTPHRIRLASHLFLLKM